MRVLCLNAGSSSLKAAGFVVDERSGALERVVSQRVEHVGEPSGPDHLGALAGVADGFDDEGFAPVDAVAHRLVHGGPGLLDHCAIDDTVRSRLDDAVSFAPLHLVPELAVVDAATARYPSATPVACFDTAFHRHLAPAARRLPIPAELDARGIRRYGFHGLSYEYLVLRLGSALGRRAVLAHLGNGASLAAVWDGVGVDTTMGLTPTGGMVMGTRPGDLDPGVLVHLLRVYGLDAAELERVVDRRSGLVGVSGRSSDVRDLLAAAGEGDEDAALALEMYEGVAAKHVAAMTTVLGGLDTLVFTAGVGEHAAPVRAGITTRLSHLGVVVDDDANAVHAPVISPPGANVTVRVEPTDEEAAMALHASRVVGAGGVDGR